MELIAEHDRRVSVEELDTARLLSHARKQAVERKLDDMLIVDVDSHHYENESYGEILPFMENAVLRQITIGGRATTNRTGLVPGSAGFTQEMGGRITRYPLRSSEKMQPGRPRDVQIGERWMDAMSVDYSCLLPTGMLNIGMHPQKTMEAALCGAYNRWLVEKVLPESRGRMYSMLCLPFSDPDESLRQVEAFGDKKGVKGFMVATVRHKQVNDNAYMRLYRALEERGLALGFHSGVTWTEPVFQACNSFLSVHALGFAFYNVLHCTNWVVNGMGERFPRLPVIWVESGLAWIPFLMQRLDHEYMMRPSEAPLLKKKPSDYMRDMYYSSQPIEIADRAALECTFRMIHAETQLLYSSDYPHWDFDLPSAIHDLPFLTEKARHNIMGGNAARLFRLPPRNDRQKENLRRFGNLSAAR